MSAPSQTLAHSRTHSHSISRQKCTYKQQHTYTLNALGYRDTTRHKLELWRFSAVELALARCARLKRNSDTDRAHACETLAERAAARDRAQCSAVEMVYDEDVDDVVRSADDDDRCGV